MELIIHGRVVLTRSLNRRIIYRSSRIPACPSDHSIPLVRRASGYSARR